MRQKSTVHPDQLPLRFESHAALDQLIERRASERLEADAFHWRLRIIMIEAVLLALLVGVLATAAGLSTLIIARASLMAGAACFAAGMIALGLTSGVTTLLARIKRWRRK